MYLNKIVNSTKFRNIKVFWWDLFFNGILAVYAVPWQIRIFFFRLIGAKVFGVVHANCYIASKKIKLGKDSYINRNCCIDNYDAMVTIGSNCAIGFNVTILTTNHEIGNENRRAGKVKSAKVTIGNGVWVGANVVVLPGTIIEDGAVIAAGSIVGKIINANSLYTSKLSEQKRILD